MKAQDFLSHREASPPLYRSPAALGGGEPSPSTARSSGRNLLFGTQARTLRVVPRREEIRMSWQAKINSKMINGVTRKDARRLLYQQWNRDRRSRRKEAQAKGPLLKRYGR